VFVKKIKRCKQDASKAVEKKKKKKKKKTTFSFSPGFDDISMMKNSLF
jgi:hypothetical protein